MNDEEQPYRNTKVIINPIFWEDIGNKGLILTLEDNKGNKLEHGFLTESAVDLVEKCLQAIDIEHYEYNRGNNNES